MADSGTQDQSAILSMQEELSISVTQKSEALYSSVQLNMKILYELVSSDSTDSSCRFEMLHWDAVGIECLIYLMTHSIKGSLWQTNCDIHTNTFVI